MSDKDIKKQLWEKYRKPIPAREEVKLRKPSIKFNDKGDAIVITPWHQELPAMGVELYFWNSMNDVISCFDLDNILLYCKSNNLSEKDKLAIIKFSEYVLETANAKQVDRDKKREEDIIQVRRDINFYEEEGTTEKEFEDED